MSRFDDTAFRLALSRREEIDRKKKLDDEIKQVLEREKDNPIELVGDDE